MRYALLVCNLVYLHQNGEFILHHTYDGKEKEGSLHYKDRAFDGSLPSQNAEAILGEIRLYLGDEYNLIVEPGFLHVEWDPK